MAISNLNNTCLRIRWLEVRGLFVAHVLSLPGLGQRISGQHTVLGCFRPDSIGVGKIALTAHALGGD